MVLTRSWIESGFALDSFVNSTFAQPVTLKCRYSRGCTSPAYRCSLVCCGPMTCLCGLRSCFERNRRFALSLSWVPMYLLQLYLQNHKPRKRSPWVVAHGQPWYNHLACSLVSWYRCTTRAIFVRATPNVEWVHGIRRVVICSHLSRVSPSPIIVEAKFPL